MIKEDQTMRSVFLPLILCAFFIACDDDASSISPPADDPQSSSSSVDLFTRSSSSEEPIGNVAMATICRNAGKDECEYGTLKDERDGQTYKTIKIGDQEWMAENLKFVPEKGASGCFKNSLSKNAEQNCINYGRHYSWGAAMDSAAAWSTSGKGCGYLKTCSPTYPVRGICPEGWHLPTKREWNILAASIGGPEGGAKSLMTTSGWDAREQGDDLFGFGAVGAGSRDDHGNFKFDSTRAFFWSSTEFDISYVYIMDLDYRYEDVYVDMDFKWFWFSIRCVKD